VDIYFISFIIKDMNEDVESIITLLDKINELYPRTKKPTSPNKNIKPDVVSNFKTIIDKQIALLHEIVDYISVIENDNSNLREQNIELHVKLNEGASCHI